MSDRRVGRGTAYQTGSFYLVRRGLLPRERIPGQARLGHRVVEVLGMSTTTTVVYVHPRCGITEIDARDILGEVIRTPRGNWVRVRRPRVTALSMGTRTPDGTQQGGKRVPHRSRRGNGEIFRCTACGALCWPARVAEHECRLPDVVAVKRGQREVFAVASIRPPTDAFERLDTDAHGEFLDPWKED